MIIYCKCKIDLHRHPKGHHIFCCRVWESAGLVTSQMFRDL